MSDLANTGIVEKSQQTDLPQVTPKDLTAARLQAPAAQRLAALGEMTGGIAHDFRNILSIIESGLTLAERNACWSEKVREFIAGARDGVDRGLKLTAQLLTFAKKQELEPRSADANELLRQLELFLKYGAGPRLRVVMQLATDIPKCVVDASQFNAAILNLVVNARDAMRWWRGPDQHRSISDSCGPSPKPHRQDVRSCSRERQWTRNVAREHRQDIRSFFHD